MNVIIFYDYEVFKHDWLVVFIDMVKKKVTTIVNDPEELAIFHEENRDEIWVGYNNNHYDQYIHKAIICGFDPKRVNDFIIEKGKPGWSFSSMFRNIKMINYDVMNFGDGGLKTLEAYMGHNIKESSVPFDIDRKLTEEEIQHTIEYCTHDVEETIQVFLERKDDFEAHMGLVKVASEKDGLDLTLLSKTNAQLSAHILGAVRQSWDDEFDIDFPSTLKVEKYTEVLDWYRNPENMTYKSDKGKANQLEIMVAGVPHVFGFGGLHGAIPKYQGEGYYLLMDVASLYPSLMIKYDLGSRNMKDPKKYEEIYHQRLQWKAEKNPLQQPLKLVLNTTYGAMKDVRNGLYDPRQANRVCIYGQLLLLDLIEKLEPYCDIIQSNTDGILVKLRKYDDYDLIDDIAYEWEKRTNLVLEFEEYKRVFQKDVNNYVLVPHGELYDEKGKPRWTTKGAYVKKLSNLDNNLPIVNKALIHYMLKDIPVETTILGEDNLKEFQLVCKIGGKYSHFLHGERTISERCVRIFASKRDTDGGLRKVHTITKRPAKFANSPLVGFLFNDDMTNVKCPDYLNKQWYIDMAKKRLKDFGVV